ncbi:MAG: hypothetical protein HQM04_18170 [Magnetococcales bacterium]|nr:hypothetical protein [Magnetococcales bacterium]MBF0116954.1 hypothetical protein [Magnetococcales bacterium]
MNTSKNQRVIIVGAAPGRESDPNRPLVPTQSGRGTAASLLQTMQLDPCSFEVIFERHYIISVHAGRSRNGDRFPKAMALAGVAKLTPLLRGRTVVLIGKKTASAFGIGHLAPCTWSQETLGTPSGNKMPSIMPSIMPTTIAWVPSPCGLNLWWNSQENRQAGEAFLLALAHQGFQATVRGVAA